MNKCAYCGMNVRTDYPVEFWCGSVRDVYRSKECMENEIGLLKEHVRRLEKAGEWVAYAANEDDHRAAIQAWEKAKEAKP